MKSEVVLYTTHCPKCNILTLKLDKAKIKYTECEDVNIMTSKGLKTAPALEVDGKILEYGEAVKWVNEIIKREGEV